MSQGDSIEIEQEFILETAKCLGKALQLINAIEALINAAAENQNDKALETIAKQVKSLGDKLVKSLDDAAKHCISFINGIANYACKPDDCKYSESIYWIVFSKLKALVDEVNKLCNFGLEYSKLPDSDWSTSGYRPSCFTVYHYAVEACTVLDALKDVVRACVEVLCSSLPSGGESGSMSESTKLLPRV